MKKEVVCAFALVAGLTGVATPMGALVRGAEKGAVRAATRAMMTTAAKSASDVAVRAGTGVLKAGCRLPAKTIVASGAAGAALLGTYEVTAGVKDSMEKLSDAGAETIRTNPEKAAEIIGVPFSPVTRLMTLVGVGVIFVMGFVLLLFAPLLRSLRDRLVLWLRSKENVAGVNR